jgi:hypothetical protein
MHIVWGLVWIGIGFLLIKYSYQIVQNFGRIGWAERNLGGGMGGTYTLWKIVGVLVICIGFINIFGGIDFLVAPLTGVFGGGK